MTSRARFRFRNLLIAVGVLLVAGWFVPSTFNAERYRHRLEQGLERALGRPVSFGAISMHLLPRPGFSVENAIVGEEPAFGHEPFARVDRIDCELGWRSPWSSRLDLARLVLSRASFNLVRNSDGDWNVESFVRRGAARSPLGAGSSTHLDLEVEDGRVDFKLGANKKPLAVSDVSASVRLDRTSQLLWFRLAGSPLRTDLTLPTPGRLELDGEWQAGPNLEGALAASLKTRGALLYDWVPLVTGRNLDLYGVLDVQMQFSGSLRNLRIDGQTRLSQLHRWDQPPPSDPLPAVLSFRIGWDRSQGRLLLESVVGSFRDSKFHLTGSVDNVFSSPIADVVLAVEHSKLEDFVALARHLTGGKSNYGLLGRVDGFLTLQGPWANRRFGGFMSFQGVRLETPVGSFPISEVSVRIDGAGVHMAPARMRLAPRVELVVEGSISSAAPGIPTRRLGEGSYQLTMGANSVPLRDLLRFGRAMDLRIPEGLDAQGSASGSFQLGGQVRPFERPQLSGQMQLHAARLLIPGLTEPLNVPRARILIQNDRVTVDPLLAVIGTSVFTGRLEHQGPRKQPWQFHMNADRLGIDQGALWFDVLGKRPPVPLLEQLPGLRSLVERRAAASGLFTAMNARGHFSTPSLSYRGFALNDLRAGVEISSRIIRIGRATFRVGPGRGRASAVVNLAETPALVSTDIALEGARLQPLTPYLPPALHKLRGTFSLEGHFETHGLSYQEMSTSLRGQAKIRLKDVAFGEFDPLQALARASHSGVLESSAAEAVVHSALAGFEVRDRRVIMAHSPVELEGVKLELSGICGFDGILDLRVRGNFLHMARRWLMLEEAEPGSHWVDLRVAGPLDKPALVPLQQVSRQIP